MLCSKKPPVARKFSEDGPFELRFERNCDLTPAIFLRGWLRCTCADDASTAITWEVPSNNRMRSRVMRSVASVWFRLRNKYSNNRIPFRLCPPYHSDWLATVYYIDTVCGVFFAQTKKQEKETSANWMFAVYAPIFLEIVQHKMAKNSRMACMCCQNHR